jgi:hypothetical protein
MFKASKLDQTRIFYSKTKEIIILDIQIFMFFEHKFQPSIQNYLKRERNRVFILKWLKAKLKTTKLKKKNAYSIEIHIFDKFKQQNIFCSNKIKNTLIDLKNAKDIFFMLIWTKTDLKRQNRHNLRFFIVFIQFG